MNEPLQIQLKSLAEEMQAIIKGLEKVKQELEASENDGPVSEVFSKVLEKYLLCSLVCSQYPRLFLLRLQKLVL